MQAAAGEHAREVLVVDGMFCASCAAAVEAVLRRQPGVLAAQTHFAADAAVVEWDPALTSLTAIRAASARLGYPTRLLSEPDDTGARKPLYLGMRLALAVFCAMWSMFALVGLYFGAPDAATAHILAVASGVLAAPALAWSGWPFYVAGWRTLRAGVPGVDALILLGALGAVVLSVVGLAAGRVAVYFDTALVLVTLQLVARLVDQRVRAAAAERVRGLLVIERQTIRRLRADGGIDSVNSDDVARDDRVCIEAGDIIGVDGVLEAGALWVDRARLTGESAPVHCTLGDRLWAGDRVTGGSARLLVTASAGKRRIDALATQVRRVLTQKPAWQARVDRLARYVLPVASGAAVIAAACALLLDGASTFDAATRALAVFVIACPCALSLAVPLATTRAMDSAAHHGAIIRDLDTIQHYRKPDVVVLDKTGTLTKGAPEVVATHLAPQVSAARMQRVAAQAAHASQHPLARAVAAALPAPAPAEVGRAEEIAGQGVVWHGAAGTLRLGSAAWLRGLGLSVPAVSASDTEVHVADGEEWLGAFVLRDALRDTTVDAIAALQASAAQVAVISGDRPDVVAGIGTALGIEARGGYSPEDKLAHIEALRAEGHCVAYCGDGINDGPALAAADIGVAVDHAAGAAQAAAAIALQRGGIERLPQVLGLLAAARRVTSQNLVFAVAYNAMAIPLAIAGYIHPLVAATAMGLSSLTILASSVRLRARPVALRRQSDGAAAARRLPVAKMGQG